MRVYHGSYIEVDKPDIMHSRKKVDFGVGFCFLYLKGAIHYESESDLVADEICKDYFRICEGKWFVYEGVNGFFLPF